MTGAITPAVWTKDAVCASIDPELWFPEKGNNSRSAKKICAACPVREECLRAALEQPERYGVWGGLSEHERRKLRPTTRTCKAEGCDAEFSPGPSHAVFCSDNCRKAARNKSYDDSVKALLCIQCGGETTTLRCQACTRRHVAASVQPRKAVA